jgi:hypothetical protein
MFNIFITNYNIIIIRPFSVNHFICSVIMRFCLTNLLLFMLLAVLIMSLTVLTMSLVVLTMLLVIILKVTTLFVYQSNHDSEII